MKEMQTSLNFALFSYPLVAGGDAPQFDSSAFGADAGAAFGAQNAAGGQDFQGFQGFEAAGAQAAQGGQVQQFDASAFAGAFGGDAENTQFQ